MKSDCNSDCYEIRQVTLRQIKVFYEANKEKLCFKPINMFSSRCMGRKSWLGCYIGQHIAGYIEYTTKDKELYLSAIEVLPEYRRRGVATALVEAFVVLCQGGSLGRYKKFSIFLCTGAGKELWRSLQIRSYIPQGVCRVI